MALELWVSVFSATISFSGLVLVILQLRHNYRQRESESLVEIYDINRQLISLGFSYPVLFEILEDKKTAHPLEEKRYLQLWLNQLSLSHSFLKRSMLETEFRDSFERNLADFMSLENMQRHWNQFGMFYPVSFQHDVNEILKKVEPPAAAQPKSGR